FMVVWAIAVGTTGYASVGSLLASILTVVPLGFFFGLRGAIYAVCVALLILWRHRENIERLRAGRENRLIGGSSSASNPGPLA
ncbi:MAG: glycerol-3-phosphate acyltransferase, partial [Candidatus Eremiobacteraeota bacterium]|nr:glycerol-3-phosphate acyltransferase [Candidatus Eremiobacteraeota bacterium]